MKKLELVTLVIAILGIVGILSINIVALRISQKNADDLQENIVTLQESISELKVSLAAPSPTPTPIRTPTLTPTKTPTAMPTFTPAATLTSTPIPSPTRPVPVTSGVFTAAKDSASPSMQLVAGDQTVTAARFKFTAQNESFTLTELFLKLASGASAAVDKAILKDGTTVLAQLPFGTNTDSDSNSVTDSVNFTGLTVEVPANSSKVLTVDLDLADVSTDFSTSGLALQLTADEMTYLSSAGTKTTDTTPGIGGTNPTGNAQLVYKGYPLVTANVSGLSGVFTNGSETELYKWKVRAVGSSVAITQFKFAVPFTDVNTQDLKVDQFKLFRGFTDITGDVAIRNKDGASVESATYAANESADVLYITWDDDKEELIGTGEEIEFTLKGVPAGFNSVQGSKDSVAFTLVADNDESADVRNYLARDAVLNIYELSPAPGQTQGATADFIWSDVSSTAHNPDDDVYGSNDWHNGYLVEQLNLWSKAWALP